MRSGKCKIAEVLIVVPSLPQRTRNHLKLPEELEKYQELESLLRKQPREVTELDLVLKIEGTLIRVRPGYRFRVDKVVSIEKRAVSSQTP